MGRSDVDVTEENVRDRIDVYVYELNLLMRLAATFGITIAVDTVERTTYTEIVVHDAKG